MMAFENTERPIWSDEHTGARFTYGLNYRPAGTGHIPSGWLIGSNQPHPSFRHGVIQYPRQLTAHELAAFELTPVLSLTEKIAIARKVVALAPVSNRSQAIALDNAESHPDAAAEVTVDRVWHELLIERYHQDLILQGVEP